MTRTFFYNLIFYNWKSCCIRWLFYIDKCLIAPDNKCNCETTSQQRRYKKRQFLSQFLRILDSLLFSRYKAIFESVDFTWPTCSEKGKPSHWFKTVTSLQLLGRFNDVLYTKTLPLRKNCFTYMPRQHLLLPLRHIWRNWSN